MPSTHNGTAIYTIGHSNVSAQKIIELLQKHHIEIVVDVRSAPYSRYSPQFNRETLAKTLESHGIEYAYAGDYLGGRPKDPTCYRQPPAAGGKTDYRNAVDYAEVARRPRYQRGLERLMEIAQEKATAILCSEENPRHCHRHWLIAQSLLERGFEVQHIRGDGRLEPASEITEVQQLSLLGEEWDVQ